MPHKILKGIDVSEHQYNSGKTIDWERVAAQIDFAMIRTGFSTTEDQRFSAAVTGALRSGIPVGVYHYSHAKNASAAESEAKFVLDRIRPYRVTWPVAFDMEDPEVLKLGKESCTKIALSFCNTVADAGYIPALYTTCYWLNNVLDKYEIACHGVPLWIAWTAKAKAKYTFDTIPADGLTKHPHTMWQFCTVGDIDGIAEKVDLDISYVDYGKKSLK